MVLWKEYQRIKKQDGNWTDSDVRILLNFAWELQVAQYDISEELKKALKELFTLRKRLEFYRNVYPVKEVK